MVTAMHDFGSEIAAGLAELRRHAESLMTDTVRVTRIDPDGGIDPVTGEADRVTVYPDPMWPADHPWKLGPAKLQNQTQYEQDQVGGAHVQTVQRSLVHFPVGSFQMRDGDMCAFLTSTAPFVAGQEYRLAGEAPLKTYETAYRVYADQIVA